MIVLMVVVFVLLVMIAAFEPHQSIYSEFERQRRTEQGGSKVEREVLRHQTYDGVVLWLHIKEILLALTLVLLLIYTYDLARGLIFGILAIFGYRIIARLPLVYRQIQKLYDAFEATIIQGVQKLQPLTGLLQRPLASREVGPASREELIHEIEQASRFFDQEEYGLLKSALEFNKLIVRDYMTPRGSIDSVSVSELLGPLVLDDLHKTGHHQFPVISKDIDHIVGVLDVQDLLVVGDKTSPKVKNVMDSRVCYVHETEMLESALSIFIKTKRHLLVVVNDLEETVGILSLGDLVSVLMGRAINSQFDDYDDLRAVASRKYDK